MNKLQAQQHTPSKSKTATAIICFAPRRDTNALTGKQALLSGYQSDRRPPLSSGNRIGILGPEHNLAREFIVWTMSHECDELTGETPEGVGLSSDVGVWVVRHLSLAGSHRDYQIDSAGVRG